MNDPARPDAFGRVPPAPAPEPRDPRGRFVPGCTPGPGRPKGSTAIDLRAVVARASESEGFNIDQALWAVVRALCDAAQGGDTQAAKLLFDRLCGRETLSVEVAAMSLERLILESSGTVALEHDNDPPPPRA